MCRVHKIYSLEDMPRERRVESGKFDDCILSKAYSRRCKSEIFLICRSRVMVILIRNVEPTIGCTKYRNIDSATPFYEPGTIQMQVPNI